MRALYPRIEARYYQTDIAAIPARRLLNLTAEYIVEMNQYNEEGMANHQQWMAGPDAPSPNAVQLTPAQLSGGDRSDLLDGI